ncbi:DNA-binding transcriptional regulator [Salinibacterium xinjiangense]|uniref:DNA-binding transcriptional regulator LsrR, DeoR family n=1 Tax=Salinibacterium xinjiangense TaxID=386302 RepID=A0A2C8ZUN2_9MICO|nr:sugar-binding domain-containing protein [Salinibacterium xinjiangense]GGL05953.1 DNA-binding transcriptional regulator [Salinibacterium xinjiangense]SOE69457.1 DNA-binding transcriptional regulator LsrR, DeoR family [Salinibacterium xinjiangense]
MAADPEPRRFMTKVARMYYTHGIRQVEIASSLGISQARVSRLLQAAEQANIVRTVVVIPEGLHAEVEENLQERYGLSQVHIVESLDLNDEAAINRDLGEAAALILSAMQLSGKTIGFTSWSRSLRSLVNALEPSRKRSDLTRVVEMLGDVGPPQLQHDSTRSTQRFADLIGGSPLFIRAPGVLASAEAREAMINYDVHTREAIAALDELDVALVGIGACNIDAPLEPGGNFFTVEQFDRAKSLGAVGQINLRFIDAEGTPIQSELDSLVIGVTLAQLPAAGGRFAVAGGRSKYEAVRAALRGHWIDTLVTDMETAERLLRE